MGIITVQDIHRSMNHRKEKQNEIFFRILGHCFKKIEKAVLLKHNFCYFEVPEFLLGFPTYSINECIVYLQSKLSTNGFSTIYYFPRIIQISWNVEHSVRQEFHDNRDSFKGIRVSSDSSDAECRRLNIKSETKQLMTSNQSSCRNKPKLPVAFKSINDLQLSGRFVLDLT